MNPIVIAGGIIALLFWNNKSKKQTQVSESDGSIPSPANPSGLDKSTGSSTTSEPIPSPANPSGLDRTSEPIPNPENPDVLQKDVEPSADYEIVNDGNWSPSPANPSGLDRTSEPIPNPENPDVLQKDVEPSADYEIVNDGNWSPSPANPKVLEEELMLGSSTPAPRPANPKGLVDVIAPQKEWEKMRSQAIANNPSTERRYAQSETQWNFITKLKKSKYPSYRDFADWVERKRNAADFNQLSMRTTMSESQRLRYILRFLDQKEELNNSIIDDYIKYREDRIRQKQLEEQRQKERAAKPKPKVFAGKVLDENGNYVSPTSQDDCPSGYKYISQRGWSGCVNPERYEEIRVLESKDVYLLPTRLWRVTGKTLDGRNTKNSLLLSNVIVYKENNLNSILKQRGLFSTDTLNGVSNSFKHRGVVWGQRDEKLVAHYPVKVKLNSGQRKTIYVIYPVTQQEYKDYQVVSQRYLKYLGQKK